MTAYERTNSAAWGVDLGREMACVEDAIRHLHRAPHESEVEESIGLRADAVVRALRGALRAAKMVSYVCRTEDTRPVKRKTK